MIRWFTHHPVAPNLLLLTIAALAFIFVPNVQKTTFPQIPDTRVSVSVTWQGATAVEIEDGICKPLEQSLKSVENISSYTCSASDGAASLTAIMDWGSDYTDFYEDIKSAVDGSSLPLGSKTPNISKYSSNFETAVGTIAITGIDDLLDLKEYTEALKDKLTSLPNVSQAEVSGFDDLEMIINLIPEKLKALNLSVSDVSTALSRQSLELSLGELNSLSQDYTLKIRNRAQSPNDFSDMIIGSKQGAFIRLGDIAEISQNFNDPKPKSLINGKAAGFISVSRSDSEDMLTVSDQVKDFIQSAQADAPQNVKIELISDMASMTRDRLDLVIRNGISGLILAFFVLWLFFNLRYSFWITIGLPASFAGGLVLMLFFGQTINVMTLVGLLVSIGILMDDAIVVSENISAHYQKGKSKMEAAIDGTYEVLPGVISSFLTTVIIAVTVSFLDGQMGATLRVIPIVMIMVLCISLMEAFWILPAHLGHSLRDKNKSQPKIRRIFYKNLYRFRDKVIYKLSYKAVAHKTITLSIVAFSFLTAVMFLKTGIVRFESFPSVEGNTIEARILYPTGFNQESIETGIHALQQSFDAFEKEYKQKYPKAEELVETNYVRYGYNRDSSDSGEHKATIVIDINPKRQMSADEIAAAWLEHTGDIADVISLNILQNAPGPGGDDLAIRVISDNDDALLEASLALENYLYNLKGVKSVIHDLRAGAPEWILNLKPLALELGFSAQDIASQIRSNLFGSVVDELQIGNDTLDVKLRLGNKQDRNINLLEELTVKSPTGFDIPLTALVSFEQSHSPSRIIRRNGGRINTVKASLDKNILLDTEAEAKLRKEFLTQARGEYPEVIFSFGGRREDRMQTMFSLINGFIVGLFGIYAILALLFRSWLQPFVVIFIIPMGFAGTMFGHLLLGYNFSLMSMMGVILLSGVAVNDSILLVTFIRKKLKEGFELHKAAALASKERFRAVLLTSVTTIAGVTPLLLEKDIQAQVIQPLAVSIAFGLLATTLMVLFLAPVLFVTLENARLHFYRLIEKLRHEWIRGVTKRENT